MKSVLLGVHVYQYSLFNVQEGGIAGSVLVECTEFGSQNKQRLPV